MRFGRIGQLLDDGLHLLSREPVAGAHWQVAGHGDRHGVICLLQQVLGLDRSADGGSALDRALGDDELDDVADGGVLVGRLRHARAP